MNWRASPHATAIGGTEFTADYDVDGNDAGFVPEAVWNDGDGASGGGQSKVFKKPAFQKGLIPKDKKRDVPDISFGASPRSPGFFFGGRDLDSNPAVQCCIGGTSIGAPSWAGISETHLAAGRHPVGNLNARIYQLGAEDNGASTGIRDVTSGNNSFNGVTGFSAGVGYDKASGRHASILWTSSSRRTSDRSWQLNVKPAVGFTLPWAGVTPAPSESEKRIGTAAGCGLRPVRRVMGRVPLRLCRSECGRFGTQFRPSEAKINRVISCLFSLNLRLIPSAVHRSEWKWPESTLRFRPSR